jgi:hypothetical protein
MEVHTRDRGSGMDEIGKSLLRRERDQQAYPKVISPAEAQGTVTYWTGAWVVKGLRPRNRREWDPRLRDGRHTGMIGEKEKTRKPLTDFLDSSGWS